ncbi:MULTISPECIES: hypothetical protein [unclassified Bradyrhizobium]|uniref:hypothetical protein n=1 Tax=unclassified Bradyrhizobium TaxID=2631580 RepID=UPI0010434045|nr:MULTISPECIES: hypothetical protein [unclassified Bradyrhizobium]
MEAEALIRGVVSDQGLKVDIVYGGVFEHCTNDVTAACPSWKQKIWKGVRHPAAWHFTAWV